MHLYSAGSIFLKKNNHADIALCSNKPIFCIIDDLLNAIRSAFNGELQRDEPEDAEERSKYTIWGTYRNDIDTFLCAKNDVSWRLALRAVLSVKNSERVLALRHHFNQFQFLLFHEKERKNCWIILISSSKLCTKTMSKLNAGVLFGGGAGCLLCVVS